MYFKVYVYGAGYHVLDIQSFQALDFVYCIIHFVHIKLFLELLTFMN